MNLYRIDYEKKHHLGMLSKNIDPARTDKNQGMKKQKKKVYTVLQLLISCYQSVSEVDMPRDGIYCQSLVPCPLPLIILLLSAEQGWASVGL